MTVRPPANVGDLVGDGEAIPGNVIEVVDRCPRTWARDGAMFRYADAARSSITLTDSVGPVTVTKISDEQPADGEWVTVRPDDPRIVNGSRVRLGGVEGEAFVFANRLRCRVAGRNLAAWVVHHVDGPDVELWVPAEPTLPLPTGPGLFWGRVERDHETYVGWVLRAPVVSQLAFVAPVIIRGAFWHGSEHVTRLPVPQEELEKLR